MPKLNDITGRRFGRVVVLGRAPNQGTRVAWKCRCDCGVEWTTLGFSLTNGETLSCGCRRYDAVTKHGNHGTPTYKIWQGMIGRCERKSNPSYPNYGGRGIVVCQRWRASFEYFLADMGERPDGMSLDRINNDGNYEPGNCRWATGEQQRANTRRSVRLDDDDLSEIHGRCEHGETQKAVAARFGVSQMTISRIRRADGLAFVASSAVNSAR